MTAELAVDRGIMAEPAIQREPLDTEADLAPVIELHPKIDPVHLSREDFLGLPDGRDKRDILVCLRRDPYNPEHAEQVKRLFPEGYESPLSEIEKRVFAAMGRIMNADDGVILDHDARILEEYLHDIPIDQAMIVLQQEGVHRREGHFWATREEVGGYKLSRLKAYEIDRQAEEENALDEAKMHSLEEMESQLARRDYQMRDTDRQEMEKLREEYDARERSKSKYWEEERKKGYRGLSVN